MDPEAANDRDDAGGQARRWVMRLASGATTADDLRQLHIWLDSRPEHRVAFDQERGSWRDMDLLEDAFASAPGPLGVIRHRRRPRLKVVVTTLAAGIVALCFAPALLLHLEADYRAPAARPMTVSLADGSTAVLDAGSALSVDFSEGARSLSLLKGRAWFQVRHGDPRPFRVHAGHGVTQDVGTAFAVEEIGDEVRVGVTQGAVRVSGQTGPSLFLTAGKQAYYPDRGDASKWVSTDPAMIGSWRRGEILIRAMPIQQALVEIGRYRTAPIFVWGDLSALPPVSGSFRTDQPDDAIDTLIVMRGLQQIRLPAGILVIRAPPGFSSGK